MDSGAHDVPRSGDVTRLLGRIAAGDKVAMQVLYVRHNVRVFRFIARLAWPSYLVALVLLVLVMRYGHTGKGAQRWIDLGGLQLHLVMS